MKAVYLDVTSFSYVVGWAKHFYGTLRCRSNVRRVVRLDRAMTAGEAKEMNRLDGTPDFYEAGTRTERFDSEDAVREAARAVWREEFPDGVLLLEASVGSADPVPILDGDDAELVQKLNALDAEADACGGWEDGEDQMPGICKRWDGLLS